MWAALGLTGATALALVGAGVAGYRSGYENGAAEVTAQWNADRAATAAAHAEELMKARQQQQALTELNARLKVEHRREVDRIVRRYRADLERLRDRPEARADSPSGLPDSPDSGTGCTGRGLARLDAELLTGYAANAARLQSALNACQAAYDQVRQSLMR